MRYGQGGFFRTVDQVPTEMRSAVLWLVRLAAIGQKPT